MSVRIWVLVIGSTAALGNLRVSSFTSSKLPCSVRFLIRLVIEVSPSLLRVLPLPLLEDSSVVIKKWSVEVEVFLAASLPTTR